MNRATSEDTRTSTCTWWWWHSTLVQTSRWHQNKSSVFAWSGQAKTEVLFWYQWEVWTNQRAVSPCTYDVWGLTPYCDKLYFDKLPINSICQPQPQDIQNHIVTTIGSGNIPILWLSSLVPGVSQKEMILVFHGNAVLLFQTFLHLNTRHHMAEHQINNCLQYCFQFKL